MDNLWNDKTPYDDEDQPERCTDEDPTPMFHGEPQNLNAAVTEYAVDVADFFMPDIDIVEYIERDCFVLVTPCNKRWRQFHGYVEATFPDYGVALVRKVGSTWRELFTLDEMKLIYGAGVAEKAELAFEEKTLHSELHNVS